MQSFVHQLCLPTKVLKIICDVVISFIHHVFHKAVNLAPSLLVNYFIMILSQLTIAQLSQSFARVLTCLKCVAGTKFRISTYLLMLNDWTHCLCMVFQLNICWKRIWRLTHSVLLMLYGVTTVLESGLYEEVYSYNIDAHNNDSNTALSLIRTGLVWPGNLMCFICYHPAVMFYVMHYRVKSKLHLTDIISWIWCQGSL